MDPRTPDQRRAGHGAPIAVSPTSPWPVVSSTCLFAVSATLSGVWPRTEPRVGHPTDSSGPEVGAPGGATRHDVPDSLYRALGRDPRFESTVLLLDRGDPEASAVLVAPGWLLTAGHEVEAVSGEPKRLQAVVGADRYRVVEAVVHPDYETGILGHGVDLALLRLERPVADIAAAARYRGRGERGRTGISVGFGVAGSGSRVITDPEPAGTKRAGTNTVDRIGGEIDGRTLPDDFLIADFDDPERRVGNRTGAGEPLPLEYLPLGGDSGGGLYLEQDGEMRLAGIVSGSTIQVHDDLDHGLYGSLIYWVRLSDHGAWIDEVIRRTSPESDPAAPGEERETSLPGTAVPPSMP